MPDDFEQPTPVVGENPQEGEEPEGEETMDLPDGVLTNVMKTGTEAYQHSMAQAANASQLANGVLQLAAARNFDELGTRESRAHSGVIGTPVATPTTQGGTS